MTTAERKLEYDEDPVVVEQQPVVEEATPALDRVPTLYRGDWDDAFALACRETTLRYLVTEDPEGRAPQPRS